MATAAKEVHKWTPEETRRLIRFRAENEHIFLKSKAAAKQQWELLIKEFGLEGKVTTQQISKKWENLKKKYKELRTPKTGSGTDAGETTASTWQFFEDMHQVLGARPSMDPPVVVASYSPDDDPVTLLMEIVEPTTSTAATASLDAASTSDAPTSDAPTSVSAAVATPTPSPRKKKRKVNHIVDYLTQESAKEQTRHDQSEEKTERFLSLFERLIDKI